MQLNENQTIKMKEKLFGHQGRNLLAQTNSLFLTDNFEQMVEFSHHDPFNLFQELTKVLKSTEINTRGIFSSRALLILTSKSLQKFVISMKGEPHLKDNPKSNSQMELKYNYFDDEFYDRRNIIE